MDGVWKDIYLDVKKAINHFYDLNVFYITAKKIRKYLDIEASDRTKINFIWRILQHLVFEGYLEVIDGKTPKQYKISKFPIENNMTFVDYQHGVFE